MPLFDDRFQALTGHRPFPWQRRLFERFKRGEFPACSLPLRHRGSHAADPLKRRCWRSGCRRGWTPRLSRRSDGRATRGQGGRGQGADLHASPADATRTCRAQGDPDRATPAQHDDQRAARGRAALRPDGPVEIAPSPRHIDALGRDEWGSWPVSRRLLYSRAVAIRRPSSEPPPRFRRSCLASQLQPSVSAGWRVATRRSIIIPSSAIFDHRVIDESIHLRVMRQSCDPVCRDGHELSILHVRQSRCLSVTL